MKLAYPDTDMPTFQLSLGRGLDPRAHLAIGGALAPLCNEGALIIGGGLSYHNLGGFFGRVPTAREDSKALHNLLIQTAMAEPRRVGRGPEGKGLRPREEHLLPLMIVAGAAGDSVGTAPYRDEVMGVRISAAHFG